MISLLFVLLAGICNAVMDVLSFRYYTSVFYKYKDRFNIDYWNPNLSWANKWKDYNPDKGERFLGSSTIFVALTDGWHLFKSLMLTFLSIAIALHTNIYHPIVDFLLVRIAFGIGFNLFFKKILFK